jgi:hypothetical protein
MIQGLAQGPLILPLFRYFKPSRFFSTTTPVSNLENADEVAQRQQSHIMGMAKGQAQFQTERPSAAFRRP